MKSIIIIGLILSICLIYIVSAFEKDDDGDWDWYKQKWGKNYEDHSEDARRRKHFEDSKRRIDAHNKSNSTYKMGINKFSDWSQEERNRFICGNRCDEEEEGKPRKYGYIASPVRKHSSSRVS